MSVPKNKRGDSNMEFIANARKLQIYTVQRCTHFPKRYTFYIGQPIAQIGTRIYEFVKLANSIYPSNQHEAQIRRDYLIRARAECNNLISQIEVASEMFAINPQTVMQWSGIVDEEIKLISGVMRADKDRLKNLN